MKSLLISLIFLSSVCFSADLCQWHREVTTNTGSLSAFVDTECVDIHPLSVIHLESINCQCVADIRIIGTRLHCGTNPSTCNATSSSTFLLSLGNHAISVPPGLFVIDQRRRVGCGETFKILMNSSCLCEEEVEQVVVSTVPVYDAASGTWIMTQVESTQLVTVALCGSHTVEENISVVANCVHDCNPLNPPATIIVE